MLLHLLWDEKITHRIIKTFETVFPGGNEFIYWYDASNRQHFAHEGTHCHVIHDQEDCPVIDYSKVSKVVIHGLDYYKVQFCRKHISSEIPVYWVLWGAELYNMLLFNRGYRLYYKDSPPITLKGRVGLFLKRLGLNSATDKTKLGFFKDRSVTMVCSRVEYDLFRSYYPKETLTLQNEPDYFYYPIDEILGDELMGAEAHGDVILVGNSASWTNNHEYVFDYLKKLRPEGKMIVTPLNYGGNDQYVGKISELGKKYFGDFYTPLTTYLPLKEYNKLMTRAEVCIYGSWRQEAMGNIVVALYLGAKVFMSDKSPLYCELKRKGLYLYKLEDISQQSLDTPLSPEQKSYNRNLLISTNTWDRLKDITYRIFK